MSRPCPASVYAMASLKGARRIGLKIVHDSLRTYQPVNHGVNMVTTDMNSQRNPTAKPAGLDDGVQHASPIGRRQQEHRLTQSAANCFDTLPAGGKAWSPWQIMAAVL